MARTDVLPTVRRYPRSVFLDRVWTYRPDEHVTVLGKTGSGKTYLCQELLQRSATPDNPALVLVKKPRDRTLDKWRKTVAFKKVTGWPQPITVWQPSNPPGYVVWPPSTYRVHDDNARFYDVFQRAIMDSYKRGNRIIFADEVHGLQKLGLTPELETVWEEGRSMRCSLWVASQRPAYISTHAYSQASHVFLAKATDKRVRQRFGEISGVDEYLVREVVASLGKYEWLYIRQEDGVMCIIEK